GHHSIEEVESRTCAHQAIELAAGDENEAPPGLPEPGQRGKRSRSDDPVVRDRPVVVTRQAQVAHIQYRPRVVSSRVSSSREGLPILLLSEHRREGPVHPPVERSMVSASRPGSIGFTTYSSNPAARQRSRSSSRP